MGFRFNPHDPCVAKSQIKGKQCTVAWYVDDNKISHMDDTKRKLNTKGSTEAEVGNKQLLTQCHLGQNDFG
jgi:hypothetical protein